MANGKVKVKLIGEDGNMLFILAKVRRALIDAGFPEKADRMFDEVINAGGYHDALRVVMQYVDID